MPSRLIREGILTSDRIESLGFDAEVFYRRLLSKVDDFGLYDARLSILRATLYPLRLDRVKESDCRKWLAACVQAGLVEMYVVDGKTYLHVLRTGWTARSEPKFPRPSHGNSVARADENTCAQVNASVPVDGDVVVVDNVDGDGDDKRARPTSSALPSWMPAEEWDDWCKHRGRKLTAQARKQQIRKLDELRRHGHDPGTVIRLAIESGWATFYPPRGVNGGHKADKLAATAAAMHGSLIGVRNDEPNDITAESLRVA